MVALCRALTEAAQSRLTAIAGSRDDLGRTRYRITQSAEALDSFGALAGAVGQHAFSSVPTVAFESVTQTVEFVATKLEQAGFRQILTVDLSRWKRQSRFNTRSSAWFGRSNGLAILSAEGSRWFPARARQNYEHLHIPRPSLSQEHAVKLLEATYLPPIQQGDLIRLLERKPQYVGIVDGYFETVPAVWHKEILFAMGARCSRVRRRQAWGPCVPPNDNLGMVGIGIIFQWICEARSLRTTKLLYATAPPNSDNFR